MTTVADDTARLTGGMLLPQYAQREAMRAENGVRAWLWGVWSRVAQPRVQRIAFLVVYVLHIVAGVSLITVRPEAVQYTFNGFVVVGWASFLVLGGVLGTLSVLPGWNFVERVGLLALLFGVALTALFIVANPWQPVGIEITIWSFVFGWLAMFLFRLWEIKGPLIAAP